MWDFTTPSCFEGARGNKIKVDSVDRCCLNKFSSGIDERRARVQPCHTALALMRALAAEVVFPIVVPNATAERGDFAPYESKSVPQRLKPSSAQPITARLNPCPSLDSLFPSLSGAVQIGQPKNLIWTGVKFSRPCGTQFSFCNRFSPLLVCRSISPLLLITQRQLRP